MIFSARWAVEHFIDRAIRDSHRPATQLPQAAVTVVRDCVRTELIGRGRKRHLALLCVAIQCSIEQTHHATEIARAGRLNWRSAGLANARAFAHCRHSNFSLCGHRLAQMAQLLIDIAGINYGSPDLFPQNCAISSA